MSILDKVIAAVTPTGSPEERVEARLKARQLADEAPWLAQVLRHHEEVEAAFEQVRAATDASARRRAQSWLATLLNGHSLAEEAVLYPAMALGDQKMHASEAYTEQSAAKINIAALETLDPMTQDYLDKLEHVRNAVALHVYQEESRWYPKLVEHCDTATHARLQLRYTQEFDRYMGPDAAPL